MLCLERSRLRNERATMTPSIWKSLFRVGEAIMLQLKRKVTWGHILIAPIWNIRLISELSSIPCHLQLYSLLLTPCLSQLKLFISALLVLLPSFTVTETALFAIVSLTFLKISPNHLFLMLDFCTGISLTCLRIESLLAHPLWPTNSADHLRMWSMKTEWQ